jgi:HupE / UreJ protein
VRPSARSGSIVGFATALHQLELPTRELVPALLGYNLGVELGQVAIVLAATPRILTCSATAGSGRLPAVSPP